MQSKLQRGLLTIVVAVLVGMYGYWHFVWESSRRMAFWEVPVTRAFVWEAQGGGTGEWIEHTPSTDTGRVLVVHNGALSDRQIVVSRGDYAVDETVHVGHRDASAALLEDGRTSGCLRGNEFQMRGVTIPTSSTVLLMMWSMVPGKPTDGLSDADLRSDGTPLARLVMFSPFELLLCGFACWAFGIACGPVVRPELERIGKLVEGKAERLSP